MKDDLSALLARIRQGDENAFDVLCQQYRNLIDGTVRRFLPSFEQDRGTEAELYTEEDLRQYATIALYRASTTYAPETKGQKVSFGLYAKICVQNALISQLRKQKTEKRRREAARRSGRAEKREEDPLQQIVSGEDLDVLMTRIGGILSGYEKRIFEAYITGKSIGEIAERLGKDKKSVSNAVYRMKTKVKGLLKNQ